MPEGPLDDDEADKWGGIEFKWDHALLDKVAI